MATLQALSKEKNELVNETYKRINEAEENRPKEFHAVLRIQAWFRGQRVRSYLKYLHQCATMLQARWRGFIGRRHYREYLKNKVFMMKLNKYNAMATKIQKVWKGYFVRKYVFNYHSRKRYLEGLQIKNELIRGELNDYAERQAQLKLWQREEAEKKQLENYARKHHHLLSTEAQSGIYNSPFQPYPDEMEFHLRRARPRTPKKKDDSSQMYDPGCTSYSLPRLDPLPPIGPKPQGPFRDPREVQKQRYKPFKPSLRVSTNYMSVEEARQKMKDAEWVTRLNDDIFQPFKSKTYPYEPLLHTQSQFGHLPYGTKYYRERFQERFIVPKEFKTVIQPIPIFEKLNDTYSQGQV